ncbi:hypothetical protein ACFQ4L_08310 [Lapidilactobacillus mulanensis]|uniref:Uncharacterized protein n=1 Tax=Lapidilactobacillus mulanensis TaxID=2485999 RepID=A0ABW4DPS0_9LACO|nr:hypothetical protein [Lapidilactobacillus mulanensis]
MFFLINNGKRIEQLYTLFDRQTNFVYWVVGVLLAIMGILVGFTVYVQIKMSNAQEKELRKHFKIDELNTGLIQLQRLLIKNTGVSLLRAEKMSRDEFSAGLASYRETIHYVQENGSLSVENLSDIMLVAVHVTMVATADVLGYQSVKFLDDVLDIIEKSSPKIKAKVPEKIYDRYFRGLKRYSEIRLSSRIVEVMNKKNNYSWLCPLGL